ncbi:MAG: hypothetical protein Fur0037_08150 [Planctomycetota bacterium]
MTGMSFPARAVSFLLLSPAAAPGQQAHRIGGMVSPARIRVAAAPCEGVVERVFAEQGDEVDAKTPLVALSWQEGDLGIALLELRVRAAELRLEIAREEGAIRNRELMTAEREAKAAAEDPPAAQAAEEVAADRRKEAETLFQAGRISPRELAGVRQQHLEKQVLLRQAERLQTDRGGAPKEARLRREQARQAVSLREIARDEWALRHRAAVQLAEEREVRSPIAARVARVFAGPGERVARGARLAGMAQGLVLRFRIPQDLAGRVGKGSRLSVFGPGGGPRETAIFRAAGIVEGDGAMSAEAPLPEGASWLPGTRVEAVLLDLGGDP